MGTRYLVESSTALLVIMNQDRGNVPNHGQALLIITGLEREIRSLRDSVQLYKSKWHDCRKHLRMANRSLEIYSRLTKLQSLQNIKLQEEYKKRK